MKVLFFDTESDGLLPDATRLWCAAAQRVVGDQHTSTGSFVFDDLAASDRDGDAYAFLDWLDHSDVLVGHNIIGHDLPLMRKLWGYEPRPDQKIVDTLLMSRLQRPDRRKPPHTPPGVGPHSVEAWGYRFGVHKQEHEDWTVYSEEMLSRCEQDVVILRRIYDALLKEGKGEGWMPAHRLNMKLFTRLQEQEENGFAVDHHLMEASVEQLTRWIDRIDRVVTTRLPVVVEVLEQKEEGEWKYVKKPFLKEGGYAAITERFLSQFEVGREPEVGGQFTRVKFRYTDLDSSAEVKDFLLKSGWIPDEYNYNNAGHRTSPKLSKTDNFRGVQGALGKLIVRRVQCKQRRGVIEGWLRLLNYPSGGSTSLKPRLHGAVHGLAVTGRAKHRVIVNVPGSESFYGNQMRSMFVANEPNLLVGVDSVANQVRQLAARMGDDEFTRVVLDPGIDIHSYNASRVGSITRHEAKTFFYALIFGAGDGKLAKDLAIPREDAKQLRNDFMRGLPAVPALLDRLEREWASNGGWIRGLDGRPISVSSKHKLLVYLLQSDEAIQMGNAYVLCDERLRSVHGTDLWKWVLWMHDEFQFEAHPSITSDVADVGCWSIKEAGERLGIPVPHEGAAKIGRTWKETH
jgi:DNA polymerase I-like protein with 3'-5' exonuclease and polymerase domains